MEFFFVFLVFYDDFDYFRVCCFCLDFDLDVLELFINGVNFIVFFDIIEFIVCSFFCEINDIVIGKYVFCI